MEHVEKSFVDKYRPIKMTYHEMMDSSEFSSSRQLERAVKKITQKDPNFLDPYLMLCEAYQEEGKSNKAEEILDQAYNRAIELITDENGNWPEYLVWGFTENRHIIRAIFNRAVAFWDRGETDQALDLLRKLLKTNPPDNVGARNYILAIRMNISFDEYEDRFDKGGYYDSESINWFEMNAPDYPDEFGWWFEWTDEHM